MTDPGVGSSRDQPTVHVIRSAQQVEMPWKNGHGVTSEICRIDDAHGLLWRASVARVTGDCAFSLFEGCDRIIVLIDGDPIDLRFGDGTSLELEVGQPHLFSCERPVSSVLRRGACRDFNLIWRRAALQTTHSVVDVHGRIIWKASPATWHLLSVASGVARVSVHSTPHQLMAGDALLIVHARAETNLDIAIESEQARALLFALRTAETIPAVTSSTLESRP